jgi:hypothetical protein
MTSSKKDTSNIPTPSNPPANFISPASINNDMSDWRKNSIGYQAKLDSNPNALNNFKLFENTSIQNPWTLEKLTDNFALINRNTYYSDVFIANTPARCATRCLADSKCKGFMIGGTIREKYVGDKKLKHNNCFLTSLDPKSVKYTNSTNIDWDDSYINNNNINEYNTLGQFENK